jgi:hypothetical protein
MVLLAIPWLRASYVVAALGLPTPLSLDATRPWELLADRLSSASQIGLIAGGLPPKNLKYRGIEGFSQAEHRPPPTFCGFRQESKKLSPLRNFCTITI